MKRQYLVIDTNGRALIEGQIARLPAMLSRGFHAWELKIDEMGTPDVGLEVTIDEGTLVEEKRRHTIKLGGIDIGHGDSKSEVREEE